MSLRINNSLRARQSSARAPVASELAGEMRFSPEHPEMLMELFCALTERDPVTGRSPISPARCGEPRFLSAATEGPIAYQHFCF